MTAITNAFNLAHRGAYSELSFVAPGDSWEESFWIHPSGFE
jgi:aldose 1-epimerase